MASTVLDKREAMQAYRAVCEAFEVEPHPEVVRQGEGRWPTGPVLCESFEGWFTTTAWAVVWEGGPFEWAMYVPHGGQGFAPARLSDEIFAEPINGFALGLYRA